MLRTCLALTLTMTACSGGLRSGTYRYSLESARSSGAIEQIRNPLTGHTIRTGTHSTLLDVQQVEGDQLCFEYLAVFPRDTNANEIVDKLKSIRVFAEAHDVVDAPDFNQRPSVPADAQAQPWDVSLVSANEERGPDLQMGLRFKARMCTAKPASLTPSSRLLTVAQLDVLPDLGHYQPCPEAELGKRMCIWQLTP